MTTERPVETELPKILIRLFERPGKALGQREDNRLGEPSHGVSSMVAFPVSVLARISVQIDKLDHEVTSMWWKRHFYLEYLLKFLVLTVWIPGCVHAKG